MEPTTQTITIAARYGDKQLEWDDAVLGGFSGLKILEVKREKLDLSKRHQILHVTLEQVSNDLLYNIVDQISNLVGVAWVDAQMTLTSTDKNELVITRYGDFFRLENMDDVLRAHPKATFSSASHHTPLLALADIAKTWRRRTVADLPWAHASLREVSHVADTVYEALCDNFYPYSCGYFHHIHIHAPQGTKMVFTFRKVSEIMCQTMSSYKGFLETTSAFPDESFDVRSEYGFIAEDGKVGARFQSYFALMEARQAQYVEALSE